MDIDCPESDAKGLDIEFEDFLLDEEDGWQYRL